MVGPDTFDEELLVLIARRLDFLEELCDTALEKRDLVDVLGHSRSTVNRAVAELETAGLVTGADRGYTTTVTGRLAADMYRQIRRDATDIQNASTVLAPLPADSRIDLGAVSGADSERTEGPPPYRTLGRIRDAITGADSVRGFVPMVANLETLRACHATAIQHGTPVELLLRRDLFERLTGRFGAVFSEMALTDEYSVLTGETPQFTGLRIASSGQETVALIVYTEDSAVHGVLLNTTESATRWFENCYQQLRAAATDRTDELIGLDAPAEDGSGHATTSGTEHLPGMNRERSVAGQSPHPDTDGSPGEAGRPDAQSEPAKTTQPPAELEAEGFVRLCEAYFDRREPQSPAVCWRTGLDIVEVHAGYAIDREWRHDGQRMNLTDHLVERLRDGRDHVLLGPPGSGKSTVCKSVACRWYENGLGPVFYRESGYGQPFDSRSRLERHLRRASGHALVVVEDAVRDEANTVFRLMQAVSGDSTVTFLLDSRATEWQQPEEFPSDAGLEAYRQEAVETTVMPELDRNECRRLVRHFEDTIAGSVSPPVQSLLGQLDEDAASASESARPGRILLFLHRLASYADPLSKYDSRLPTTLTQDIQQTYDRLQAAESDRFLDVGVTVNLLNATGIGVYPDLVHAVADEGEHQVVREALSALEGHILFPSEPDAGADSARYRTVHESWSRLFLTRLGDVESPRAAQQRFGRCVTALLALADDTQRRERIHWEFEGEAAYLSEITIDPGEWADDFVRRLFTLGQDYPSLAPLFGRSEYSAIDLPDACSPALSVCCTEWRGEMYRKAGEYDRAAAEFERLATLVRETDVMDTAPARKKRALSLIKRGEIEMHRGDLDTAETLVTRGLHIYEDLGDSRGKAASLLRLGVVALTEGDYDTAEERIARSLERYRDCDDKSGTSRCLGNLAIIALRSDDLDAAAEYATHSLDVRRALGDRHGVADSHLLRGEIALERGVLDDAEEHLTRSFEIAREIGATRTEANSLLLLGDIEREKGNRSAAVEYLDQSLDIWEEIDVDHGTAECLRKLGAIRWENGEYEAAEETLTRSLETVRTVGDRRTEAETLVDLGEVALERGAVERARERLASASEAYRAIGVDEEALTTLERLIEICVTHGEKQAAREHCEEAVELAEQAGLSEIRTGFEDTLTGLSEETAR